MIKGLCEFTVTLNFRMADNNGRFARLTQTALSSDLKSAGEIKLMGIDTSSERFVQEIIMEINIFASPQAKIIEQDPANHEQFIQFNYIEELNTSTFVSQQAFDAFINFFRKKQRQYLDKLREAIQSLNQQEENENDNSTINENKTYQDKFTEQENKEKIINLYSMVLINFNFSHIYPVSQEFF